MHDTSRLASAALLAAGEAVTRRPMALAGCMIIAIAIGLTVGSLVPRLSAT